MVIFLWTFGIPIVFLVFTYGSIGVVLRKHVIPGNANNDRDQQIITKKLKVMYHDDFHCHFKTNNKITDIISHYYIQTWPRVLDPRGQGAHDSFFLGERIRGTIFMTQS